MTPWLRQRAQVGDRLTALLDISSMPWGALVSPPVAESEGQWWTAGISLGSMDLGAGVEGQGGHIRGSCPDYPSCLSEATPKGFSHFAHPGTQLSPLILPWLSPFFTLPGASSSPRTSLLVPFLRIFRSKHYSLLTSTFPSTNTSLGHTQALSCPLQQFLHSPFHHHPIPTIFLASSSTITILPSCSYPIPTHAFMLPFQSLTLMYAVQFNFPLQPF